MSRKTSLQPVQDAVLAALAAVAGDTEAIASVASMGIEPVLDRIIREACRRHRVDLDDYIEALGEDDALREAIQARVKEVLDTPAVQQMRRELQHKEAERTLYLLRYVNGGDAPPRWVWESVDPDEREQIREVAALGEQADPALLPRLERALEKIEAGQGYGVCEDCRTPIPEERLKLVPWAERCAACETRHEGSAPSQEGHVPVRYFFRAGRPVDPDE